MFFPRLALLANLLPFALAPACSSSSDAPPPADDAGATVTCQNDSRVDTYVANLSKTSSSGALKVAIVSSDPAPPTRYTNTWKVRVTDGGGAPIQNPSITVTPFMPDHGHGTSIHAVATPEADGTFTITPLYLFMPGVWRVTIALDRGDAGATDQVEFFFCIAG